MNVKSKLFHMTQLRRERLMSAVCWSQCAGYAFTCHVNRRQISEFRMSTPATCIRSY